MPLLLHAARSLQALSGLAKGLALAFLLSLGGMLLAQTTPSPAAPASSPFSGRAITAPKCRIDELVFSKLEAKGLRPSNLCSDAVFVRRVYLDAIGRLPTAAEAREFLSDKNPAKRDRLIERLLASDDYADYWLMKWCDLLRVKSEFPVNLWPNAVQAYQRWLHDALVQNKPFDRFARELLVSNGSNFRSGPVNFYRAMQGNDPQTIAKTVALTFLGARIERWSPEQRNGLAAFFCELGYKGTAEWKEQIVYFDPTRQSELGKNGLPPTPVFPDGTPATVGQGQDPREVFADWLLKADNPWFARALVNRAWSWFLGRGLIQEPDDIRPDNPASNPELLAYLEKEFVQSGYDLKKLYALILSSQVYQQSPVPRGDSGAAEEAFACYPLRRLEAEVLIDALNQITGSHEKYSSAIPEPFTFIPPEERAVSLGDGSITSSFLELYGRSSRDTGLESERNNRPNATQALHMLNSSHVQKKIEQSGLLRTALANKGRPAQAVDTIYLSILSRFPTSAERAKIEEYAKSGTLRPRELFTDLVWALLNSAEFAYRH